MSIDLIQSAINLNNEGVTLMEQGSYQESISNLSKSVRVIKSLVQQASSPAKRMREDHQDCHHDEDVMMRTSSSSLSSSSSSLFSSSFTSLPAASPLASPVPQHHQGNKGRVTSHPPSCPSLDGTGCTTSTVGSHDDDLFFYGKPIEISMNTAMSIEDVALNQDVLNIYSACVIYNLALGYHHEGNHLRMRAASGFVKHSNKRYTLAKRLYSMAMKIVNGGGYSSSNGMYNATSDNGIAVLIRLAVTNNMSQLLYVAGDYNESKKGFVLVASILQSNCFSPVVNQLLDDSERVGFYMNSFMLLCRNNDIAPAA